MTSVRQPRYVVIEQELRAQLAHARAGDPLPSEAELSTRFGVSRMTARQAVKALEAGGLVYRVPGSGTFASGSEAHRTMGVLRSFTDDMAERGVTVTSQVLVADWCDPSPELRAALALTPTSKAVRIERIRIGDGVPMALETVAMPPWCAFVLEHDLSACSLHHLLESHGIVPTEAMGTLIAESADPQVAHHLQIAQGEPLLVERRRITDQAGQYVESTVTRYVGSKYIFDIHLRRSTAAAGA